MQGFRSYLSDPDPIDDFVEPRRNPGGQSYNGRVLAAVPKGDVDALQPVPAAPVRRALNTVVQTVRDWRWYHGAVNRGAKTALLPQLAASHPFQEMPIPIPLHHGDTLRIQPEPWSQTIPPFGG